MEINSFMVGYLTGSLVILCVVVVSYWIVPTLIERTGREEMRKKKMTWDRFWLYLTTIFGSYLIGVISSSALIVFTLRPIFGFEIESTTTLIIGTTWTVLLIVVSVMSLKGELK